jgi:DNA polymerase-3 subunit delta'
MNEITDRGTAVDPWTRLAGQERAVGLMERAAARPVHSYLLVGAKGADLLMAARCFATALIAPESDARTVDLVLKGAHPDVVEFEPESTVISVAQAREEIVPEAFASPIEPSSARKVIVVLEAERLQLEAENALLKTFEEPPASTVILLVTSAPDDLLDTTRSRCQRIDLAPLDEDAIVAALMAEGRAAEPAALAARLSGGQLGRARALVDDQRALRNAFVDATTRVDGTGAMAARLAEELGLAVRDAIAAVKARNETELEVFEAAATEAGYLPREVTRQRRRMTTRHSRHERMARREAIIEGVTALESVYRDALAGHDAPPRNLDHARLRVEARAGYRALAACRGARQALERNPNEGLLLERLMLHLPPGIVTRPR